MVTTGLTGATIQQMVLVSVARMLHSITSGPPLGLGLFSKNGSCELGMNLIGICYNRYFY